MKITSWIYWLLAVCICFSETKNKIRRPLSSSYIPTLMLKKSRPINHRISVGNPVSIDDNLLLDSHQKMPYKYISRIRRPVMYNALPIDLKKQIPIRASFTNRAVLPQRVSIKEFYSINKVPKYSSEYRPELLTLSHTHPGDINDNKGPIHTILAPNLSLKNKPYNSMINSEKITDGRPYSSNLNYHTVVQNPTTTFELITLSKNLPQKTATSSAPLQHQYEVTENNNITLKEYQTIPPALQLQNLDIRKLYSIIMNNPLQSNQLFTNHPIISSMDTTRSTNVEFDQSSVPMQTNLHTSLHVGFPATASQTPYAITQQIPTDLHVGHSTPAGSPLSGQQMFQQRLGQMFQPDTVVSFSQPQLHSFNYDKQDQMQQQQQQILLDQNYALKNVTTDYNLEPVDIHKENNMHTNEEFTYFKNEVKQSENNINYEEAIQNSTMYFNKMLNNNIISTNFYTTLPNREAAEKLAALAAAGNVNNLLIGQLRKQQRKDNPIPSNHKNSDDDVNRQQTDNDNDQQQTNNQPTSYKST